MKHQLFDIEDAVRSLRDVITADMGADWLSIREKRLATVVDQANVRVAFIGEFNAGKSSLVNALTGTTLAETNALPCSAAITEFVAGEEPGFERGRPSDVPGDATSSVIDEPEFRRLQREGGLEDGTLLKATVSGSSWPEAVIFADTPGVGSLEHAHAAVTYGYLPRADAVVLVVDGLQGVTESTLEFLRHHVPRQVGGRVLVVLTRGDLLSPTDASDKVSDTRVRLARIDGFASAPVVVVAVESVQQLDGLDGLQQLLRQTVYDRVGPLRNERALKGLLQVGAEAEVVLTKKRDALSMSVPQLDDSIRDLASAREAVHGKLRAARTDLDRERRRLGDSIAKWVNDAVGAVADDAGELVSEMLSRKRGNGSDGMSRKVEARVRRELEAMIRDHMVPAVETVAKAHGERLGEARVALTEFDIPDPSLPGGALIDIVVDVGGILLLDVILPGGIFTALLGRLALSKNIDKVLAPIKQRLGDILTGLVEKAAHAGVTAQLRARILETADEIAIDLAAQVDRVLADVGRRVETEMDGQMAAIAKQVQDARDEVRESGERAKVEKARLDGVLGRLRDWAAGYNVA